MNIDELSFAVRRALLDQGIREAVKRREAEMTEIVKKDERIQVETIRKLVETAREHYLIPHAIYCNPEDRKIVQKAVEKNLNVYAVTLVKQGNIYVVDAGLSKQIHEWIGKHGGAVDG